MPFVNGRAVPPVIPPSHVLLYFPHGILGLARVQSVAQPSADGTVPDEEDLRIDDEPFRLEPVVPDADGSLRLDADGQYYLPDGTESPEGVSPGTPGLEHAFERALSHTFDKGVLQRRATQALSNTLREAGPAAATIATLLPVIGGGRRSATSREETSGRESSESRPTTTAAATDRQDLQRSVPRRPTVLTQPEDAGRTDSDRSEGSPGGGQDRGGDDEHHGKNTGGKSNDPPKTPLPSAARSILFGNTSEFLTEETIRDAFHSHRRRVLILYLLAHGVLLSAWLSGLALDRWLSCTCVRFGLFSTCTTCGTNVTVLTPSTADANATAVPSYYDVVRLEKCFQPTNYAECSGPNFGTTRNLCIVAIVFALASICVILVDAVCRMRPRRAVYPLLYLVLWSISFAGWLTMILGITTPAEYNLTEVECEIQRNVAFHLWEQDRVMVYQPQSTTRLTRPELDALEARATVVQSFAKNCEYSWSAALLVLSWIFFTLVGVYYCYSRYVAWNDLIRRKDDLIAAGRKLSETVKHTNNGDGRQDDARTEEHGHRHHRHNHAASRLLRRGTAMMQQSPATSMRLRPDDHPLDRSDGRSPSHVIPQVTVEAAHRLRQATANHQPTSPDLSGSLHVAPTVVSPNEHTAAARPAATNDGSVEIHESSSREEPSGPAPGSPTAHSPARNSVRAAESSILPVVNPRTLTIVPLDPTQPLPSTSLEHEPVGATTSSRSTTIDRRSRRRPIVSPSRD